MGKLVKTNVLETELRQRSGDGKWQLLGRIMDHDNAYKYKSDSGQVITLTPDRWITLRVYDYILTPRNNAKWRNWKENG